MGKKLELKDLTKQELISVITELAEMCSNGNYFLSRILNLMSYDKEINALDKIEELCKQADESLKKRNELIKPYKSIDEIPSETLLKAAACEKAFLDIQKEIKKLERKAGI